MAARWRPPDEVGKHEHIGRRQFDEPMLAGGEDQRRVKGLPSLRNFEEKRDRQTSLDRLGRTGVDRAVVRYLRPLAEAAAGTFKPARSFDGWFVVSAQRFKAANERYSSPVVASPIVGPDPPENIYHAHVVTPNGVDYYGMALHLRHIFCEYGVAYPVSRPWLLALAADKIERLGTWAARRLRTLRRPGH